MALTYLAAALRELQRRDGLVHVPLDGRDVYKHGHLAVSAHAVLQQKRELGVAEGHVRPRLWLLPERRDDVAQRGEALVDGWLG